MPFLVKSRRASVEKLLAQYPGGKVRYDVKCSDFLAADVRANGGVPVIKSKIVAPRA